MFRRNVFYSLLFHALLCVPFLTEKNESRLKPEKIEIEIKVAAAVKKTKTTGAKSSAKIKGLLFPAMNAQSLLAKVEFNSSVPAAKSGFNDSRTYQSDISDVFGENGDRKSVV